MLKVDKTIIHMRLQEAMEYGTEEEIQKLLRQIVEIEDANGTSTGVKSNAQHTH